MFREWEDGLVGNNHGVVSRLPRKQSAARVVINLLRGRRAPATRAETLPTAA